MIDMVRGQGAVILHVDAIEDESLILDWRAFEVCKPSLEHCYSVSRVDLKLHSYFAGVRTKIVYEAGLAFMMFLRSWITLLNIWSSAQITFAASSSLH